MPISYLGDNHFAIFACQVTRKRIAVVHKRLQCISMMSKYKERLIDDNVPLVGRKMIPKNCYSVLIESVISCGDKSLIIVRRNIDSIGKRMTYVSNVSQLIDCSYLKHKSFHIYKV